MSDLRVWRNTWDGPKGFAPYDPFDGSNATADIGRGHGKQKKEGGGGGSSKGGRRRRMWGAFSKADPPAAPSAPPPIRLAVPHSNANVDLNIIKLKL